MDRRPPPPEVRCLAYTPRERRARWVLTTRLPGSGDVIAAPVAVGLDATDEAVAQGRMGSVPEGRESMVLGHEALLRIVHPGASGLAEGARAVPLVRRGCAKCQPCRAARSDACETGDYTEHGIVGLDGWLADMARARTDELVPVPANMGLEAVLAEPLSISVKAYDDARAVRKARSGRGFDTAGRALLVGLGSLGSTAALVLRDAGFPLDILDRHPGDAEQHFAKLVGARLGETVDDFGGTQAYELVIETPGAAEAIADALHHLGPNGVLVTLGTPHGKGRVEMPMARIVRELVTENQSLLGSVNASRAHMEEALRVLARAKWRHAEAVEVLLSTRFPPERSEHALAHRGAMKKLMVWPDPEPGDDEGDPSAGP